MSPSSLVENLGQCSKSDILGLFLLRNFCFMKTLKMSISLQVFSSSFSFRVWFEVADSLVPTFLRSSILFYGMLDRFAYVIHIWCFPEGIQKLEVRRNFVITWLISIDSRCSIYGIQILKISLHGFRTLNTF